MLRRVRSDGCPTSGASVAAHIEGQLKKRLERIAGALAEASDKSEFSCPGTDTLFLEPLPPPSSLPHFLRPQGAPLSRHSSVARLEAALPEVARDFIPNCCGTSGGAASCRAREGTCRARRAHRISRRAEEGIEGDEGVEIAVFFDVGGDFAVVDKGRADREAAG